MKKTFIKISVLSIALVVATSCKKGDTGATGATGAAGPNLSGNLQGVVSVFDVTGTKQLSATLQAGDSLVLTNNSTGAVMKTVTSSTGSYMFSGLTTGTYSMTISKAGYGTVLSQGIQFAGGGNADRNFALSVVPTTSVSSAMGVDTSYYVGAGTSAGVTENYVKVRGYAPYNAGGGTVIVFVSVPGASSTSSTVGNFSTYYTVNLSPGVSSYKIIIPTADLYDLGFVSGNTAYFAAYMVGGNTNASSYVDWATGQTVFTALSSAPVMTSAVVQ